MKRVRLFSDFNNSSELLEHLKNMCPLIINNCYKNIEFTTDTEYDHAVILNKPVVNIKTPKEKNIGFLMDIPQIYKPNMKDLGCVCKYFSWMTEHKNSIKEIYKKQNMSNMFFFSSISQSKPKKNKRMSMVVSFKGITQAQIKRKQIFNLLLKTNMNIDFFGRDLPTNSSDRRIKGPIKGMRKNIALEKYEYSISFENMVYDGWLTEKFYDCIINYSVPITNSPTSKSVFNNNNGFIFVDYATSTRQIVTQISNIYHNDNYNNRIEDLEIIKKRITIGDMSFAEKIYVEINSL